MNLTVESSVPRYRKICKQFRILDSFHLFHQDKGVPVVHWVKRWPTDLAVVSSIPA